MEILEVHREALGSFHKAGALSLVDGDPWFSYDRAFLASTDARPLSFSLPLRQEAFSSEEFQGFFAGMAPEGRVRTELARMLHIAPSDYLGLLRHLNNECIGALLFRVPGTEETARPGYQKIGHDDLLGLSEAPLRTSAMLAQKGRFSLAGAQSKVGVYIEGDLGQKEDDGLLGCYLPLGTAPSTHILKVPDRDLAELPLNELFCMRLARVCGLDAAQVSLVRLVGGSPALAIRRFDRPIESDAPRIDGLPRPHRLHQEDFIQALGLPEYRKYEIEETDVYARVVARLIERASSDVIRDKLAFARQVVFDYLVGNCDNHLKNYSFLLSPDWRTRRLAPAYDIVCTTVLGYSRDMGISIGGTRNIDAVTAGDWRLFAQGLRMPESQLSGLIADVTSAFEQGCGRVVRDLARYPEAGVLDRILDDSARRLKRLKSVRF
ncbi:MAG: HipA domain-containing protein [Coriobacteriales bacterium]|jgi:serine/threonine-protein kinase HipA|nr:HipA domain-containing protein [Coriobacteriales bacterium]